MSMCRFAKPESRDGRYPFEFLYMFHLWVFDLLLKNLMYVGLKFCKVSTSKNEKCFSICTHFNRLHITDQIMINSKQREQAAPPSGTNSNVEKIPFPEESFIDSVEYTNLFLD